MTEKLLVIAIDGETLTGRLEGANCCTLRVVDFASHFRFHANACIRTNRTKSEAREAREQQIRARSNKMYTTIKTVM